VPTRFYIQRGIESRTTV